MDVKKRFNEQKERFIDIMPKERSELFAVRLAI